MKKSKVPNWVSAVGLLTIIALLSGCVPQGETAGGGSSLWVTIIFMVVIFGAMYFLTIRPQSKRQKEHQQLIEALKEGDKVITIGGIYGEIVSISEDSIVLKVESGATIRLAKSSVAAKLGG